MITEFVDLISSAIWSEITAKMNTVIPARVDSYDKDGPYVSATPLIDKIMSDGTALRLGSIVKIPVVFQRTNRFKMSYPLEAGDGVLLLFSQRCIDEWAQSGSFATPVNPRVFALTDAIAIPGLFGQGKAKKITSAKELEIEFDDVKITSDGKKWKFTGDIEVEGKIDATGVISTDSTMSCTDVNVGSFTLKQHTHATAALGVPSLPIPFPAPVPEVP